MSTDIHTAEPPFTEINDDSEVALARRLRRKDPQALAEAYDLYGRIAFAVIVRIVHNAALAEDLVQDTFLRAWNHAEQIGDAYGGIGPWLLAIARHSALDYVKSAAAKLARSKPLDDFDLPPVTMTQDLMLSDRARVLNDAFSLLSASQRQVIDLAYYEGLSQQEIADRLHEPLGTIKGRMRLALQRLRTSVDVAALRSA